MNVYYIVFGCRSTVRHVEQYLTWFVTFLTLISLMTLLSGLLATIKQNANMRTIFQAMHRTSPLRLRNRISPDTEIAPGLDLSTTASTSKGKRLLKFCDTSEHQDGLLNSIV